jgi:hypothetical protein
MDRKTSETVGPLTQMVLEYDRALQRLVSEARDLADWAPLSEFIDVEHFERIGTFLEVQNWNDYIEMLTRWASATESFETTVRRITEIRRLVFYEIEERHSRGDNVNVINSMTVFEFGANNRIRRLNVYLQQAR